MPAAPSAAVMAEKMTTKPQTLSMLRTEAVTARARAPGAGACAGTGGTAGALPRPRRNSPAVTAARTWQAYSTRPARALPNTPTPAAPTRKAGPELLTKPSSRSHSARVITPRPHSPAVVAAPSG